MSRVRALTLLGLNPVRNFRPANLSESNAVRPLKTTIQPRNSTIHCNSLYLLANHVLPFPVFSSRSNRSPRLRPFNFYGCHPACPERNRRVRSEGSWLVRPLAPTAPFEQSLLCRHPFFLTIGCDLSTANFLSLSPFFATLTSDPQLAENPATLSPVSATLTSRVKHKSFACHSYRKHRGSHFSSLMSLGSLYCSWPAPVTSHPSQITKPCTIRTYEKHTPNPFGIRTSKTQDLKPFRMNTYEKTGEGVGAHLSNERGSIFEFPFSNFALSVPLHTTHYPLRTYRATVLRKG